MYCRGAQNSHAMIGDLGTTVMNRNDILTIQKMAQQCAEKKNEVKATIFTCLPGFAHFEPFLNALNIPVNPGLSQSETKNPTN